MRGRDKELFFFFKSLGMCGVVQYGEINRRMHLKQ